MTIEEVSMFKRGDILTSDGWTFILDKFQLRPEYPGHGHTIYYLANTSLNSNYTVPNASIGIGSVENTNNIRFATNKEKERLFHNLWKSGYEWNPILMSTQVIR